VTRNAHIFFALLRDRRGQGVVEYAVVLGLVLVVLVFVGTLFRDMEKSATEGTHARTFERAPYTMSSSGGASGQWIKDILLR